MTLKSFVLLLVVIIITACNSQNQLSSQQKKIGGTTNYPYLLHVESDEGDHGYVSPRGDTVIAMGKYSYCFTDTFRTYAIVTGKKGFIGIDQQEQKLFDVFLYDNGPDYVQEGLFRIIDQGKIGFANTQGKIVIAPQYPCAYPFKDGKAKVAMNCQSKMDGEHRFWESTEWFFIDKEGEKVE